MSEKSRLCSLEHTKNKVIEACRNAGFRSGFDRLCKLALFYKNDKENFDFLGEISEDTLEESEMDLKSHITSIVCDNEAGGAFVSAIEHVTDMECDIIPASCGRFKEELMVGDDVIREILDRYRGVQIGI